MTGLSPVPSGGGLVSSRRLTAILAILLALIFTLLGGLHVFWACGGQRGKAAAIPERDGRRTLHPSALTTLAVAVALFVSALIVLGRAGFLPASLAPSLFVWPARLLGVVFVARAIGEFRLVGFFKRVRGTTFARWDDLLFSPLCLALGAGVLWLGVGR